MCDLIPICGRFDGIVIVSWDVCVHSRCKELLSWGGRRALCALQVQFKEDPQPCRDTPLDEVDAAIQASPPSLPLCLYLSVLSLDLFLPSGSHIEPIKNIRGYTWTCRASNHGLLHQARCECTSTSKVLQHLLFR
jgi:hypothetical protein